MSGIITSFFQKKAPKRAADNVDTDNVVIIESPTPSTSASTVSEPPRKKPRLNEKAQVHKNATKKTKSQASIETRAKLKHDYEKTNRSRGFVPHWKVEFPFVDHDPDKDQMFCVVCREYPNIADKLSPMFTGCGGLTHYRRRTLETHVKSKAHQFCVTRKDNDANPKEVPMQKAITKLTKEKQDQMECLVTMAYVVASENMAFKKFETLCKMQKKLGFKLGDLYQNEKACRTFVKSIAGVQEDLVIADLKAARFFTVLADGSTDSSITEQESVYVRYVDDKGQPQTRLAAMMALEHANAIGVKAAILKALMTIGLSEEDVKAKMIGCNFDGASVMMGVKNGVAVKLVEMVDHEFIIIHCVAHNLELGALDTVKSVPYLDTFYRTVQNIFKFYYYSTKKRRELKEICVLLEEDVAFYSSILATRWVASQHRALSAIQKNLPSTISHLQHVAAVTNGVDAAKAKGILKEVESVKFVKFLHFMLDVMEIVSCLSQQFQRDDLFVSDLIPKLEIAEMRLEELKTSSGAMYSKFQKNFDEDSNTLKCGKDSTQEVKLKHGCDPTNTLHTVVNNMMKFIESRFGKLQKPPFKYFSIFDHTAMPTNRFELVSYGNEEIESLVETYSGLLTEEEQAGAISQWLELKLKLNLRRHLCPNDVYSGLLLSNPPDLKDILVLVKIMMTMSPTTAKLERCFSAMKQAKTHLRSRMDQTTLQLLMRIHDSPLDIDSFDATPVIEHWLNDTKRNRKIVYVSATDSVPQRENNLACASDEL